MMMLASLALLLASDPPRPASPPARVARVCRVEERLGTILPHRTCRTPEEWAAYDRAAGRIHEQDMMHIGNHFSTQSTDLRPRPGGG